MIKPKTASIETPSGIALELHLTRGGPVIITDKNGDSILFHAGLISEVRAILLDFERVYGESL